MTKSKWDGAEDPTINNRTFSDWINIRPAQIKYTDHQAVYIQIQIHSLK